jgi:DNA-binding Lrp family transcriptional regulator
MSIEAISYVLRHSEATLSARLVLLVLADHADHDGTSAFPSVATIARQTRMSERGVRYALRALEESGQIDRRGIHPAYGTHEYAVVMGQSVQGGNLKHEGGQNEAAQMSQIAPEPSKEPSTTVQKNERARMRYRGRAVPAPVVEAAQAALVGFSEATGQRLRDFDGRGQPTESLKRIVGAMLSFPDVVEKWPAMVARSLADPWWTDDAPGVGVIFGPNVVERALAAVDRPAMPANVSPIRRRGNGRSTAADYQSLKGTMG